MCGINGIYAYNYPAPDPDEKEVLATRDHMAARGPDAAGLWWSTSRRAVLGHRRLSIQDLAARSNQPMVSADDRYAITFGGEIYNAPDLRAELERSGARFKTTSDTEVILQLFAREGAEMLDKLRGMFALAIWDNQCEELFLARDPYGIKPLYTANDGWTFRFASQVKALLAGAGISREPEPAGVVGFYLLGSVPEPFTLYRDIRALPAGHYQIVDNLGPRIPVQYAGIAAALQGGQGETAGPDHLREALRASVKAHLLSDRPVGLFLSSGIDSTSLLALMTEFGQNKVKTITLSFEEFAGTPDDEAPLAALAAETYGAEHSTHCISRTEFEESLPTILENMDQPSIDGVNTWFVSRAAREAGLNVALSGLGGDELLGGYESFRDVPRAVALLRLPSLIPGLGAALDVLAAVSKPNQPKWRGLLRYGGSWPGAYFLRRGLFLPQELSTFLDPDVVSAGLDRLRLLPRMGNSLRPLPRSSAQKVMALESSWYMRNQLLRDADWAGMAHSVEIRTPFVDYELLKQAAGSTRALAPGQGKQILADCATAPLPESICHRRKTGFSVPYSDWIASPAHGASTRGASSRAWAKQLVASNDWQDTIQMKHPHHHEAAE